MLHRVAGVLVLYWITLVLATSAPLGAVVDLAHRDQLLEPLWPHVHLADGRIVPLTESVDPRPVVAGRGVAFGPGGAADAASTGLAITPPLPAPAILVIPADRAGRPIDRADWTGRLAEAPPDPPPDSAAF